MHRHGNQCLRWFVTMVLLQMIVIIYFGISFYFEQRDPLLSVSEVPDGSMYDLSEQAVCTKIMDYEYDSAGRLVHVYGYHERDDNSGRWSLYDEKVFTYDGENRLLKEEYYYSSLKERKPDIIDVYAYRQDGSYIKTRSFQQKNIVTVYNSAGQILQEENYFYTYDSQGRLLGITKLEDGEKQEEAVAEVRWNEDTFQSIETMRLANGKYVLWADQYNEDWQQVSGIWYSGALDALDLSIEEAERLCKPGYYADFYQGQLIEKMVYERTKDVIKGYESHNYSFYDYDETGRKIWYFSALTSDNQVYAEQYLYNNQGQLTRELHYRIKGTWSWTLVDGSKISFQRNEDEDLTNITRTEADGEVMHSFVFGEKHKLAFLTDKNDSISVYWQLTGEEMLAMQEKKPDTEQNSGAGETILEEGFYDVQEGDCLWKIAQQLWGDGNLWTLLYEENKALIGNNPSLIFEGMVLSIAVNHE